MTDQEIDEIREQFITCEPTYGRWNTDEKKLRAFARALLSRAIPEGHVVVPGWMPIESAPKDRSVMLHTKYGLTYCGRYRYGNMGEPSQDELAWRCDSSGRYSNPTHWMPLPAAPAPEGEA